MTVRTAIETIDPVRAQELIDTIVVNRNVRISKVKNFAVDIARKNWRMTGESIKINPEGHLIDGEHRLRAVILAEESIETVVTYGIENSSRIAIDTGTARTLADHLKFQGERHNTALAAALSVLHCRSIGDYTRQASPSHLAAVEMLGANPGIRDSTAYVIDNMKKLRVPKGLAAVLHYETTRIDAVDAEAFWRKLATGADLEDGSPVLLLRNRLMANHKHSSMRLTYAATHAIMIKAWNHYRQGTPLESLRWRGGGAHPEAFPQLEDTYRRD